MNKLIKLIAAASVLCVASLSQANEVCHQEQFDRLTVNWCVTQNPLSPDILYYFHGGGGNEHSWTTEGWQESLSPKFKSLNVEIPTAVVISFGTRLMKDLAEPEGPALLPMVAETLIPKIEKEIGVNPRKRLALGGSLGGYNGAEITLRYPKMFERAALLCPGVGAGLLDPFSSQAVVDDYIAHQPKFVAPATTQGLVSWIKEDFINAANWQRHAPLTLAAQSTPVSTKFYVSCTEDDDYGFFGAAEKFAALLSPRTQTQWVPIKSGGHCAQSEESLNLLINFLAGK